MNFQSINSAKKSSMTSGYVDDAGNFDSTLRAALTYVDGAIGSMVSALQQEGLLNDTGIVITAKHAESPVSNTRTIVLTTAIPGFLAAAVPTIATNAVTQKTSALIWLKNQSQTADAVSTLKNAALTLPISQVLSFGLGLPFPNPLTDPAVPDVVVVMNNGVNFEPSLTSTTHAEHGGFGVNETHVPLVVSYPRWNATTQSATVSTRQIAPTILAMLGLDPNALRAVQIEGVLTLQDVVNQLP
jgi:arylsulfatase A-like enzyme